MAYPEEDYLMLSGIQHYIFCKRQWALIHIEQLWDENLRTVEGELVHKKAHGILAPEKRKDVIITRGMQVHSREMGISGICDIVELIRSDTGISLPKHRGKFKIYPVEYKRGKPKEDHCDILQLTAQAMCLEEMLCCEVEEGALYYHEIRHREVVEIEETVREEVKMAFADMHRLYNRKHTPKAKRTKACNACSLKEQCLPGLTKLIPATQYVKKYLEEE